MSIKHNELVTGDTYLTLHRENYLERAEDVRPFLRERARLLSDKELTDLLHSEDWRPQLVGIYCIIADRRLSYSRQLVEMLHNNSFRINRRAIIFGVTSLGGREATDGINEFLKKSYEKDSFYEYAAALEAIKHLQDRPVADIREKVLKMLQRESFSIADFEKSEQRFAQGLDYWR